MNKNSLDSAPSVGSLIVDTIKQDEYQEIAEHELNQLLNALGEPFPSKERKDLAEQAAAFAMTFGDVETRELKAGIRLKLQSLLHDQHLIDITESDAKIGHRKGLKHEEQLLRKQQLSNAVDVLQLPENEHLKTEVLALVHDMLSTRFPVEHFHHTAKKGDQFSEANLSLRQVNDLAVNFFIYVLQHHPKISPLHQMVAYLAIFESADDKTILERLKYCEEKDKTKYMPPEGGIQELFNEIAEIFQSEGQQQLNRFLSKADFGLQQSSHLIDEYEHYLAAVMKRKRNLSKERRSPMSSEISRIENTLIPIPETEFDRILDGLDIMKLHRGNISARNKMLLRIMRLIGAICTGGYGKHIMNRYGDNSWDVQDLIHWTVQDCMEKLQMYQPTDGAISTYMTNWIKGRIERHGIANGLIRIPDRYYPIIAYMTKNPGKSTQEYTEELNVTTRTIKKAYEYGKLLNPVPMDAKLDPDDNRSQTFGEKMIIKSSIAGAHEKMEGEELSNLVRQFLFTLPPQHRQIAQLRLIEGKTLEEIGQQIGTSRERVRQIEAVVLDMINGNVEKHDDKPFLHIVDEAAFENWCNQTFEDPINVLILKMHLGLDEEACYRPLTNAKIQHSLAEQGYDLSKEAIRSRAKLAATKLMESLWALAPEDRFVIKTTTHKTYQKVAPLIETLRKFNS